MKKTFLLILSLLLLQISLVYAQVDSTSSEGSEKFGHALNAGVGLGYYSYAAGVIPAVALNYEFDIARNFTLAPFAAAYTYRNYFYWGDPSTPYRDYYYHRTVVPVGVKGFYYFDELFNAGEKWDFYAAGSVAFAFVSTTYEDGYGGDRSAYNGIRPLYIDAHLGTEFHLSPAIGLFLDLSTGLSTFGVAAHFQ